MRALFAAGLLLALARPAHADVIGSCPFGQHVVTNPATPGSGHHGGYHCESDCSASAIGRGGPATPWLVLGLVLSARRRRPS